jgi:hypothetical protein
VKGNTAVRALAGAALAILVPGLALAEISVDLNRDGSFRRVVTVIKGGRHAVVWRQVRPYLSLDVLLNPLGDNLGDLPPVVASHPATRLPWVFWSRNVANVKQLVHSTWTAAGWTAPRPVAGEPGPIPYDELDPAVAFDAAGTVYLVWWKKGPVGEVYFSTLVGGAWTPPLRLSAEGVDSGTPTIRLDGTRAVITWRTPGGPVTTVHETAVLVESAASLMDSPTPPGRDGDPGKDDGKGNVGGGTGDGPFIKR